MATQRSCHRQGSRNRRVWIASFVGAPAIPPLLRRLDSRSPLRAQQAGFGHADLVKHDNMEPGGNIGKAAMG
jgi:hypothetical protein